MTWIIYIYIGCPFIKNLALIGQAAAGEKVSEIVDGQTDDGRSPDHGHPISSPCEPNGSGELKMGEGAGGDQSNLTLIFQASVCVIVSNKHSFVEYNMTGGFNVHLTVDATFKALWVKASIQFLLCLYTSNLIIWFIPRFRTLKLCLIRHLKGE